MSHLEVPTWWSNHRSHICKSSIFRNHACVYLAMLSPFSWVLSACPRRYKWKNWTGSTWTGAPWMHSTCAISHSTVLISSLDSPVKSPNVFWCSLLWKRYVNIENGCVLLTMQALSQCFPWKLDGEPRHGLKHASVVPKSLGFPPASFSHP